MFLFFRFVCGFLIFMENNVKPPGAEILTESFPIVYVGVPEVSATRKRA